MMCGRLLRAPDAGVREERSGRLSGALKAVFDAPACALLPWRRFAGCRPNGDVAIRGSVGR